MTGMLQAVWRLVKSFFGEWANIALENIALRHQLAVLQRSVPRPKLHRSDRLLWVWLSQLWHGWQSALLIIKPETVISWHRQGFKLYWRWTHLSLERNSPIPRTVCLPEQGRVVAKAYLGGLHHCYTRAA